MAQRELEELDAFLNSQGNTPVLNAVRSENVDADAPSKKRKNDQDDEAAKKPKVQQKPKVQENRAIYVTNLPLDTNEEEIAEVFEQYGLIDVGADGNKRIKMYADANGDFNGEALVVFFKKDSIFLAIQMKDDYFFRYDDTNRKITVKEADLSYKRNTDGEKVVSKMTRKDKKASERIRAELNRKLAEWSDNEEEVRQAYAPKKNKWAKVCIVKYCFKPEDLEDPAYVLDIKEQMREEGERYGGTVTNVVLYDLEKDGIVSVRFKDFEAAEKFRDAAHGRTYEDQRMEAWLADERPRFKKSQSGKDAREYSPMSDDDRA